ncbi:hypothetical protein [Cellvibrio sp. NN19]|uniref:hypothetical protein n=1 Tax=Cellvibrio chitinivorans TaxID=3102792 RepID=UPI002B40A5F7|nr:hypothetical protein [Cellvibrio sp. NN19]
MNKKRLLMLCGMISIAFSANMSATAQIAQTSPKVVNPSASYAESDQLKNTVKSITIPSKVLANSWAFTNCAYCENDVADYIKSHSQLPTVWHQYVSTPQGKNLNNDRTRERLGIKLEDGGTIGIETRTTDDSISIDIVTITDPNGNNVPKSAKQINKSTRYKSSAEYFPIIQNVLSEIGYMATRNASTGIITLDTKPLNH